MRSRPSTRVTHEAQGTTLASAAAAALRFAGCRDRGRLERLMMAAALHPEGGGFEAAWMLRWDPRTDTLEGSRQARGAAAGGIDEAVERAARVSLPAPWSGAAVIRLAPGELTGSAFQAWRGTPACGPVSPGEPWTPGQVGALAVRAADAPVALIVGEWPAGAPSDAAARLDTLAAFAALGMDAGERGVRTRRQSRHLAAIAAMTRASASTANLAEILQAATRHAAAGSDGTGAALWLEHAAADRGEPRLALEATDGAPLQRERLARALHPLARAALAQAGPRLIQPAHDEPQLAPEAAAEIAGIAIAPLVACETAVGVLAVYAIAEPGSAPEPFDREDATFLGALADLTAGCVDRARRFGELERSRQRGREQAEKLRREERRAALGDLALRLAEEARNPLASIAAFARRMQRDAAERDPNREYLEIIVREAARLEKLLGEQAEAARPEPARLRVESLNAVVQDVLRESAESLVRRRVRLLKKLSPELPDLLLDPVHMRRVVANVLEAALDALPVGGRVRVETRRAGQHAVLEVAHDGSRDAGGALEQLFAPFSGGHVTRDGVGLNLAQQIVQAHGGEIRVRTEGEWSTIVSLVLPIRGNEDRRQPSSERRVRRSDRRTPLPTP